MKLWTLISLVFFFSPFTQISTNPSFGSMIRLASVFFLFWDCNVVPSDGCFDFISSALPFQIIILLNLITWSCIFELMLYFSYLFSVFQSFCYVLFQNEIFIVSVFVYHTSFISLSLPSIHSSFLMSYSLYYKYCVALLYYLSLIHIQGGQAFNLLSLEKFFFTAGSSLLV